MHAIRSCSAPDEERWAKLPGYARRSMAITRATGKSCRIALSWVMTLAGYEPTPAEEIPERPEHVDDDGAVVLPGKPSAWGGYGGKAITDIPADVLTKAERWLRNKDAERNAAICEAIIAELERRRLAEAAETVEPKAPNFAQEPPALAAADKADDLGF